jgi:hypothetical protein
MAVYLKSFIQSQKESLGALLTKGMIEAKICSLCNKKDKYQTNQFLKLPVVGGRRFFKSPSFGGELRGRPDQPFFKFLSLGGDLGGGLLHNFKNL